MEKILKWNAEFARNLWLEFSLQRLVAMPAIILLIVVLIFTNSNDTEQAWRSLHYFSVAGFVFIGLFWGLKNAADAIMEEYNEKTWDWQKMSIIGPWKLIIGKLFGSTIYNWYGASFCWLIFMVTAIEMPQPENEFKIGILLIISMISLPGLMILLALQLLRKTDGRSKIKSNSIFILGILLLTFLSNIFGLGMILNEDHVLHTWYGIKLGVIDIVLFSSLFYCAWIIGGLYRSMRAELQYSDTPSWWMLFIGSNFLLQFGYFFWNQNYPGIAALAVVTGLLFCELIFLVYFLFFTDAKSIVNFRLLKNLLTHKEYRHFFKNVPLWLISLPVALLIGLLSAVFFMFYPENGKSDNIFHDILLEGGAKPFLFWLSISGFVIRDIGILLLLNFSGRSKRTDTAMLVYLLLLYVIMPLLTKNIGLGAAFYPDIHVSAPGMVIFPILEVSIVMFLLVKRWNEISDMVLLKEGNLSV